MSKPVQSQQQTAVLEGKSYFNFINSLKSEFTKKNYQSALTRFLNHYNITTETLARSGSKEIENLLIDYIVRMKQSKKSTSALNITVSAITHFCVMNDINIMTKKVAKFKGEHETLQTTEDRGYSHEEIQTLVNSAPLRLKVIFLIMASTGIRIGALPILRISNLKKIKTKGLYQFTIYANSPDHRYITYCTPECAKAIDEYLDFRKRFGEKIIPDSYLIRKDFDINDIEQIRKKSEPIAYDTIKVIVRNQLMKTGVRSPFLVDSHKRHDVPMNHGFRKFFETRLIESGVNPMAVMRLAGHKSGLDYKSYFRPNEDFILSQYELAINALTIDPSHRLKQENTRLKREYDKFMEFETRLNAIEARNKSRA